MARTSWTCDRLARALTAWMRRTDPASPGVSKRTLERYCNGRKIRAVRDRNDPNVAHRRWLIPRTEVQRLFPSLLEDDVSRVDDEERAA